MTLILKSSGRYKGSAPVAEIRDLVLDPVVLADAYAARVAENGGAVFDSGAVADAYAFIAEHGLARNIAQIVGANYGVTDVSGEVDRMESLFVKDYPSLSLVAPNSGARPTYDNITGRQVAVFDGVDNYLTSYPESLALTGNIIFASLSYTGTADDATTTLLSAGADETCSVNIAAIFTKSGTGSGGLRVNANIKRLDGTTTITTQVSTYAGYIGVAGSINHDTMELTTAVGIESGASPQSSALPDVYKFNENPVYAFSGLSNGVPQAGRLQENWILHGLGDDVDEIASELAVFLRNKYITV